jgi:hypothetical protein
MASAASLIAITVLWPAPTRDPMRSNAIATCHALSERLRADVAFILNGAEHISQAEHDEVVTRTDAAVVSLHRTFLATPYRPTGLGTAARSVIRLVDELKWLHAIIGLTAPRPTGASANPIACPVRLAAATVLDRCADALGDPASGSNQLEEALGDLHRALSSMEIRATAALPIADFEGFSATMDPDGRVEEFITALDPSFRAQELTFAVSQVGANVALAAAAECRSWTDRLLGRQPQGLSRTLSAAHERAASHFERHSVSLHNSLRGAIALGAAVLVARTLCGESSALQRDSLSAAHCSK